MVLAPFFLHAQGGKEAEKQLIIEQLIEDIAGTLGEDEELDYTNLFEDLAMYYDNPLDLNSASIQELRDLNLLSDIQINHLQRHIAKYGSLKTIFELQAVEGFTLQSIRQIKPFVTVGATSFLTDFTWASLFKEGKSSLFLRYRRELQRREGFLPDEENNPPAFAGSPDYGYVRYRFDYKKNIRVGFTMEKDAGESLEKGPDFLSGHLFFTDKKLVKTFVVGDYQAQFGQGLTMWAGLGFGKSIFVLNTKKNAQSLRPYSSVNEAVFLRGGAITLQKKGWEWTSFYSSKKMSGNIESTTDSTVVEDDGLIASSLNLGGLHRTAGEIENRRQVTEQLFGSNIQYKKGTFTAGLTGVQTSYTPGIGASNQLYNVYRFSGSSVSNFGLNYQGVYRNMNYFGEVSRSSNGGTAMIHGLIASLHPKLSATLLYRNFSNDYQVRYGAAFAEGNIVNPSNEQGVFFGIEAQLAKAWTLRAYVDQVKFPWLRFLLDAPSSFYDYMAQLNFKPDKKHEFYIRYRYRLDGQNGSPEEAPIDFPVDRLRQNVRLHASYSPHPNVQLKTRAEWVIVKKENVADELGFLLYQDVNWKRQGTPVSFAFRYALMDIQDWNARIYAFENDVLYRYSILAYYGRGSRVYFMTSWDIRRGMELQVRYGQWVYTDRQSISSGNNAVSGNQLSDFIAQLRFAF